MNFQSFLHGISVPGLRDLPIAYGLVILIQGGYLARMVMASRRRRRGVGVGLGER